MLVVAAGTALAVSWIAQNMTATGTITVNEPPLQLEVSSTVMGFGTQTVNAGAPITATATITANNTTASNIAGFTLTDITGVPAGLTLAVSGGPIAAGGSGTVTFTLTGTAPASATTLDLSAITCKLQPN